jgi:hypothetical protein
MTDIFKIQAIILPIAVHDFSLNCVYKDALNLVRR